MIVTATLLNTRRRVCLRIMHECDHLDGHVYLEKVTEPPEGFDAGQAEEQE